MTEKPVALEFLIKLELDFCGGRKTGEPGEKPSWQGQEPTTISDTFLFAVQFRSCTAMKEHDLVFWR